MDAEQEEQCAAGRIDILRCAYVQSLDRAGPRLSTKHSAPHPNSCYDMWFDASGRGAGHVRSSQSCRVTCSAVILSLTERLKKPARRVTVCNGV